MKKRLRPTLLFSSLPLLIVASAWSADLELVSPGAADRPIEIADRCPTFNWSAEATAAGFELVLYDLSAPTDDEATGSGPGGDVARVLDRIALPGAARGWTPALDRCLEPGRSYAWTLRALGDAATSDALARWAEPRLFTVRELPSAAQVKAALAVLDRYLESAERGGVKLVGEEPTVRLRDARSQVAKSAATTTTPGATAPAGTGTAAIRGDITDPTGDTWGVEGISHSPDGAGLTAENTVDATDLLLRGDGIAPDARLDESSLDRASDAAETFDFRNSGTGTMTVLVDGTDVVTTLTDADTLGALGCAENQVPQWNGSAWICANTGTDTLGSLSCGAGQIVHFNGTVWTCGQPTLDHVTCSAANSCSANCPAGSIVWTGGCTATPSSATLVKSAPTGNPPTGWTCSAFNPLGAANVAVDLFCVAE